MLIFWGSVVSVEYLDLFKGTFDRAKFSNDSIVTSNVTNYGLRQATPVCYDVKSVFFLMKSGGFD